MSYKILEHTSDLFIEGRGKSLEEALESVAEGMFKNMGNTKEEKDKFKIIHKGYDFEMLIIELFSKILSECEAESLIPKRMKVLRLDLEKKEIEVEVLGEEGLLENVIKAVTYHLFSAEEEKGEWVVRVLFDI